MAQIVRKKTAAKRAANQYSTLPSIAPGTKFGKWTVGEEVLIKYKGPAVRRSYMCTCECGKTGLVVYSNLVKGRSKSCKSCMQIERFCKHGHDTELHGRTKLGICRMCCKERQLKFTYGITLAEYEALFAFQEGKCAICSKPLLMFKVPTPVKVAGGRAEVDHKHLTKKEINRMKSYVPDKSLVRGLLCGGRWAGCNHKLGRVDDVDWLRNALSYVENPPAQQFFKKGKL